MCAKLMHLLGLVTEQGVKPEAKINLRGAEGCKKRLHKWWCVYKYQPMERSSALAEFVQVQPGCYRNSSLYSSALLLC